MQVTKRCPKCEEVKDVSDFPGKTNSYCKPCNNEYARAYRKANPDVHRKASARHIAKDPKAYYRKQNLRRFGLTPETFDALLESQAGRCAICRTGIPTGHGWHVDHDHACCPPPGRTCGKCVRAILCSECNTGLGKFRDDPAVLRAAAEYLERVKG